MLKEWYFLLFVLFPWNLWFSGDYRRNSGWLIRLNSSNIRSKILRRSVTHLCVFCLYRPWDYPESFGIYSQLVRKSKTCFFTIVNVYVSWIEGTKSLLHSFYLQNLGILQPRLDQRGRTPWKWIFKIQMQKWVS